MNESQHNAEREYLEDHRLVDRTCDEFEGQWRAGRHPRIEDYLAGTDGELRPSLLRELLLLEWELRRENGDQVALTDYHSRFQESHTVVSEAWPGNARMAAARSTVHSGGLPPNTPWRGSFQKPEQMAGHPALPSRYDLNREIGRGGIGIVYRARDRVLGRDLALKVLQTEHEQRPELLSHFFTEAQIGSQLQHPAIVPVYDFGESPDRRPYFTMKLVDGRTLADILKTRESAANDLPRLLGIFGQVCQAVAYAHSRNVIHRDLKPANIMVGAFGEVQVMDWGLAKVIGSTSSDGRVPLERLDDAGAVDVVRTGLSHDAAVVGTPPYMSPEQARGEVALDERSDVFSLGAILCEILTRHPPRLAADAMIVEPATTFNSLDDCCADAELRDIAKACLAHDPDGRPSNAGVVATHLQAYEESVAARLRQAEVGRAEAQTTAREERKRRRLSLFLAVSVLGLVSLVGAGAWWVQRQWALTAVETVRRETEVEQALAEARRFQAGDNHAAALAAIRHAEGRMQSGTVSDALQRSATDLRADLDLLSTLESIRLRQAELRPDGRGLDQRAVLPLYRHAFEQFGVDPTMGDVAEIAARLKTRSVWPNLRAALYDWIAVSLDQTEQGRLVDILSAADFHRDTWEPTMLEFVVRGDRTILPDLIRTMKGHSLTAAECAWVGRVLIHRELHSQAEDWLRVAQEQYPGDFWINLFFAVSLHLQKPPQLGEAIQHYTAALALRPQSAAVYINLANALAQQGRVSQAILTYQKALAIEPGNGVVYYNLGNTLMIQSRYADAAGVFHKATQLAPNLAEAHCNLGRSLAEIGQFAESLDAFRRGHELGAQQADWRYPSEQWIRNTEQLLELDEALPGFLEGEANAVDPKQQAEFARCLAYKQNHAAAARLYLEAFKANPSLTEDRKYGYRFQAARAAAFAAAGIGDQSAKLGADERSRWRTQSIEWLRAELELTAKPLEKNDPQTHAAVLRTLRRWREDIAFAEWRDPGALATFGEDERVAVQEFKNELDAVIRRCNLPPTASR